MGRRTKASAGDAGPSPPSTARRRAATLSLGQARMKGSRHPRTYIARERFHLALAIAHLEQCVSVRGPRGRSRPRCADLARSLRKNLDVGCLTRAPPSSASNRSISRQCESSRRPARDRCGTVARARGSVRAAWRSGPSRGAVHGRSVAARLHRSRKSVSLHVSSQSPSCVIN